MRIRHLRILFISGLISFVITSITAQSAFVSAGGNASNNSGNISYSVGQIDFTKLSSTTNGGVQQVYDSVGRFTMPVEFLTIHAIKQETGVLIKWETASESNSSHFTVSRSTNGVDFYNIVGTVLAAGYSSSISRYSLIDHTPIKGTNYYRIKQVDRDGRFTLSAIAAVNFQSALQVQIYPNPASAYIRLQIYESDVTGYSLKLLDMEGRLINNSLIKNPISTINVSGLKKASYGLCIFKNDTPIATFVIIKN